MSQTKIGEQKRGARVGEMPSGKANALSHAADRFSANQPSPGEPALGGFETVARGDLEEGSADAEFAGDFNDRLVKMFI